MSAARGYNWDFLVEPEGAPGWTYSVFAQYQLMHVTNRNFRPGADGPDHLLRVELTRSFR